MQSCLTYSRQQNYSSTWANSYQKTHTYCSFMKQMFVKSWSSGIILFIRKMTCWKFSIKIASIIASARIILLPTVNHDFSIFFISYNFYIKMNFEASHYMYFSFFSCRHLVSFWSCHFLVQHFWVTRSQKRSI